MFVSVSVAMCALLIFSFERDVRASYGMKIATNFPYFSLMSGELVEHKDLLI